MGVAHYFAVIDYFASLEIKASLLMAWKLKGLQLSHRNYRYYSNMLLS